ncbi:MAG: sugar transferase, partial [Clostridia bacterium]|nr:sugar transferase [Clostridia bacterium]
MYKRYIKRLLDIAISFFALIILAIPMLIIAIVIKSDSDGPVFFRQRRIGIHKKDF